MQQVYFIFNQFGEFELFLNFQSVGDEFLGADTVFNRQPVAYFIPDAVQYQE